ncbi:MAG: hypothetical protein ACFFBW_03250 [Promethearchaeota archaeon]
MHNYDVNKDFDKKLFKAIIDSYLKHFNNKNELNLWLCETLIKLMNLLKAIKNKALIKDALIIVLNLTRDMPLNNYNMHLKNFKNISLNNSIEAKHLLKKVWGLN